MAKIYNYEPAYPINVEAGSTETPLEAFQKTKNEFERIYRLLNENLAYYSALYDDISEKLEANERLTDRVLMLEQKIDALFDEEGRLVFPNGNKFWLVDPSEGSASGIAYLFDIRQSSNQTITVICDGVSHTSSFICYSGQEWTAVVTPSSGYNAGVLSATSGTVDGDVLLTVTSATAIGGSSGDSSGSEVGCKC